MGITVVASANVRSSLDRRGARSVLETVLSHDPDLVGLQEWYAVRRGLLRASSDVYRWYAPLWGGCSVGVRRERFTPFRRRTVVLSRAGRADRGEGRLGLEPGRQASLVVARDEETGQTVSLVDYHLVSGVQSRDAYRADRPRLVRRHRAEADRLRGLVAERLAHGDVVHAVGDSNLHGLRLPGLTSSWSTDDTRGTLGPRRQVDDVFGPGAPRSVTLVETVSDHRALVVTRAT